MHPKGFHKLACLHSTKEHPQLICPSFFHLYGGGLGTFQRKKAKTGKAPGEGQVFMLTRKPRLLHPSSNMNER